MSPVFANLARLLAALLLAGSGVVIASAPAQARACSCGSESSGSVEDRVRQARDVFTGVVTRVSREPGDNPRSTRQRFQVEMGQVYKGNIDTAEVEVEALSTFRPCGQRQVSVDERLLFFISDFDATLVATSCGEAERATDQRVERIEELLGSGRPPVAPEPQPVTFTMVDDAAPQSLSRAAAPGLALVIVGLLGLFVVRRLSRPRDRA